MMMMMRCTGVTIELLVVGKLKNQFNYIHEGVCEYVKRLSPYCKVTITEIAEEPIKQGMTEEIIKQREAERIRGYLPESAYWVALTERGKHYTSPQFAQELWQRHPAVNARNQTSRGCTNRNQTRMIWVVGGPLGLAASVIDQSHWQVSLSSLTFPHPMVRLVWVEQIYRAFRILNNEPYHK
jgi:23S rRNA (pseudouridine1915-N3)-methyltransferase